MGEHGGGHNDIDGIESRPEQDLLGCGREEIFPTDDVGDGHVSVINGIGEGEQRRTG